MTWIPLGPMNGGAFADAVRQEFGIHEGIDAQRWINLDNGHEIGLFADEDARAFRLFRWDGVQARYLSATIFDPIDPSFDDEESGDSQGFRPPIRQRPRRQCEDFVNQLLKVENTGKIASGIVQWQG